MCKWQVKCLTIAEEVNMTNMNSVVAIYNSHSEAEGAVEILRKAGIDVTKLSIVGRGYHTEEQVTGYYNTGDRMKYWGKFGAFWGGLWGLLVGAAVFLVPGVGPILVAGPFAAAIVGALEAAVVVGGLSAIGAGLYSLGIPKNSIVKYETALKADKFLLIMVGTGDEVGKALDVIRTTQATEVESHPAESSTPVKEENTAHETTEVPVGTTEGRQS